jgi:hypothetical protein
VKMILLPLILLTASTTQALEPACETYLAAAEKTARQPARHSVVEMSGGIRMEAIVMNNRFFSSVDGKWREMKTDLRAPEAQLLAQIRSGKHSLHNCRLLGREKVGAIDSTVIEYHLSMAGMPDLGPTKAYVGNDGLIYAQSGKDTKVRQRFTGVSPPKL